MRRMFCSESGLALFFTCLTLSSAGATANALQCSLFHEAGAGKFHPCHFLSYSAAGNRT